ncbi:hypothetical protein JCGZ_00678 [Jatropha curcas]|uniref:F-box associated beta-propeller type 1 domain-containing protein n=2 Tax=Jatropha curcas TaxID=180498 RepID=A0A067KRS7_JATCU|nr:hypothetical protein JCGZ_00678 [Jatropha curcas]
MSLNPPFDSKDFFAVVGSCNGLVCLFGGDSVFSKYRFFLWNPSIRKYLLLPLHQSISWRHSWENYVIGFGFDSKTHDYKVLSMRGTFVDNGNHFSAELYSLNANSWKNISNVAPKFDGWISHKSYSCSVNDAFHWLAYKMKSITETECVIMVFDLRDEVLREMKLPQCLANSSNLNLNLKVYVCGESSIAVIHQEDEKNSSIWVMKEYGVVESWVKLGTVGKRWRGKSRVLGFRCNGDALLHFNRGPGVIASQNIESKRVKNFISTVRYSDSSVYSYMESLALLDKGADVSANGTSTPK